MNKKVQQIQSEYDALIKKHDAELDKLNSEKLKAEAEQSKAEAEADAAMKEGDLVKYDKAAATEEKARRMVRFYTGRMEAVKADHSSELSKLAEIARNGLLKDAEKDYADLRTTLVKLAYALTKQIDDLDAERAEASDLIRKIMTAAGTTQAENMIPKVNQGFSGKKAIQDIYRDLTIIKAIESGQDAMGFSADSIKNWL